MKIVELHNHVLFQVDDGAKSLEQAQWMIDDAIDNGVDILVCTPHYNERYQQIKKDCEERLAILQTYAADRIQLYLGLEIMLDDYTVSYLRQNKIWSINQSRYLLVEFPMEYINDNALEILQGILDLGYIPIIAHPERHHELPQNKKLIKKLVEIGCLFQMNSGSLLGKHGKYAKENAKEMLLEGLYSTIASDAHDVNKRRCRNKEVASIINPKQWQQLHINMLAIVNNEVITGSHYQPKVSLLKKIFGKY